MKVFLEFDSGSLQRKRPVAVLEGKQLAALQLS